MAKSQMENWERAVDALIAVRKEARVTQTALADATGMRQAHISRMERKRQPPTLDAYTRLADALGYEIRLVKKS